MTVSTIVDNATSSVVNRYPREAGPIVENLKADLADHIEEIAERLIEGGTSLGARREQVEALLVSAGLVEPTPEPEPEEVTPDAVIEESADLSALKATVASIESSVQSLVDFAKRHGF